MPHLPDGWWDDPELRPVLADRDLGALFRWLQGRGYSQRKIALMAGMLQSEISDITAGGRHVRTVDVLERVADSLGIPRGRLGVAYVGPNIPAQSSAGSKPQMKGKS